MKNRPSYYYEDIVTLNKIDLDRITVKKINFSKYSVLKTRYNMSEQVRNKKKTTTNSYKQR